MDFLGRRIGRRVLQLGQRFGDSVRQALPGYCAFCLTPVGGSQPWCASCYAALPWNRHACRRCGEPMPASTVTAVDCGRCLKSPPAFDASLVPLRYESHLTQLIHRFKFSADPRAGEILVRLLASAYHFEASSSFGMSFNEAPRVASPVIVGVPGQRARTRERGFDHVGWLTQRLAGRLQLPVCHAIRQRETPTQRGLDRRERQRNVKAAFVMEQELPNVVVVLDDVMTTGATLHSLAVACHSAGAKRVVGVACARTPSGRI